MPPVAVPPAGACSPSGGGPYWIEEGAPFIVEFACATGRMGVPLDVAPLPAGATFDPVAAQLRWTPGFDQAAVYRLQISGAGETGQIQIGVADRFDDAANVPPTDPEGYPAEMGLPVMFLDVPTAINAAGYSDTKVTYRGHVYAAEAKLRGQSSSGYPKKNFTIKFKKNDLFNEPDLGGGLMGLRRLMLITTFDDNSQIRHRLAFEIWNRLGPTAKIRHYNAVVYVNGRFNGVYEVADHVDADLFARAGLSKDGNLYKVTDHAGAFFVADPPVEALEKKDGKPPAGQPGSHTDILGLYDFAVKADPAVFLNEIGTRIHLPDYEAWMITILTIHATDSMGKNAYHWHDPAGGPFRMVPSDFNASFGQNWATGREAAAAPPVIDANGLWKRIWADPILGGRVRGRWKDALQGPLRAEVILGLVDQYVGEVAAAARRDERRWRAEYVGFAGWSDRKDFSDFDGEVAYLRAWVAERWPRVMETLP